MDPAFSKPTTQDRKGKLNVRYVPKAMKPKSKMVKFDAEANTKADILADKKLKQGFNTVDGDASCCSVKYMDPNFKADCHFSEKNDDKAFDCMNSGKSNEASARSRLHEISAANNWKPPIFECCKEEGPDHMKLFTFKVVVEIKEAPYAFLECFGAPRSKKKTAAEHAAEGALWYLRNVGYFPVKKSKNKK